MKYNFDKLSERRHTHSEKWNVKDNELPMWVADMDYMVMPEIQEAVKKAATDGSYGYSYPTEEFFKAYQNWWKSRHDLELDTKAMIYVTGVVSALDSLVRTLTNENDNVMILSPVYNNFFTVVTSNKRNLIVSDLIYQNDNFYIDYEDVEAKIKKNSVKLFIFCNPHNPIGKIWEKEDIKKLYNVLKKYNVQMISDEIHCDIVDPGYKYVKVGINYGDDLWKIANVDENTTITVTLAQKEKYIKEQLVRDIHYSDEQGNQADEEFANFRNVNVGRIKENVFFRGASPCNNEHKRAAVVDKLIKETNINYIVNLSDSDEEINEFIFSNDFNSPYFLSLYNDNKVVALSMSMQFKADDFSEKLIQGLNNLSQSDGPFLIHCVEGKDRTGFVCMILEALAGASYDEIVDDYMLTYKNYYNITKETDLDRYNIIKEKNIDTMLKYISNINNENNIDLSTLDYEKNVTDFLVSKGMTLEDVTRLKDRITK